MTPEKVQFRGRSVLKDWPEKLAQAQTETIDPTTGKPRVPYQAQSEGDQCHDCCAINGELHVPGCDMERCPGCGRQAISCPCNYAEDE